MISAKGLISRVMGTRARGNMLWSFIDQFMVSGSNFVIGIAAARYLGITEFGKFTLVLMIAGLATVVQSVAVSMPMVTLVGKSHRRGASYFSAVTIWGLALSVGFGLVTTGIVTTIYLARDGVVAVELPLAVAAISMFLNMHDVVRRILFCQHRGGEAFVLDGMRFGLFGASVVILHLAGVSVDAAMMLALMGGAAALAILPFVFGLAGGRVRWWLFRKVWNRHWLIARWLLLMTLVATGQEQIIWIGVAAGLGDAAVGALRAGQYLLGVTHFIMMAVENFLPRQAGEEFRDGGVPALRAYLLRQTFLLGAATVFLILVIAIPARFWLATVFGPEYARFAPIVWIYAASYSVIFVRSIWAYYLRTIEDTRAMFWSFLTSSLFALALAYPAIVNFGIVGAATLVLAAQITCMAGVLFRVHRHVRATSGARSPAGESR